MPTKNRKGFFVVSCSCHFRNKDVFIFFTIVFTFYPICRLCFLLNCYYISVCNVIREVTVQYVVFFMEDLGGSGKPKGCPIGTHSNYATDCQYHLLLYSTEYF